MTTVKTVEGLATARTCSDLLFNELYKALYDLAKAENHGMYMQALNAAKTDAQKKKCAGCYAGRWQVVFNAWCLGKIANVFIVEAIRAGFVSDVLLLRAEDGPIGNFG